MAQLNWDDLRSILALVQSRSLSQAGQRLGLSYTTVARRVQRAEDALGYPLFERHPDGYVPLPKAHEIARAAERMEQEELGLMRRLSGQQPELSGPLTFTAPQLLIQTHLAPLLAEFTGRYPDVDLSVKAGYDVLDLSRREADLALRISHEPQSALVGRRLCDQRSAFFATPDIVEAAAKSPERPVDWLLFAHQPNVPEVAQAVHPEIKIRARLDDMGALIAAAEAGMGVLRMPLFLGLASSHLTRLPHLPATPYAPIWLLNHRDLQGNAKLMALKDILIPWFRQNLHLFQGGEPKSES
ncbi:LysR family transcriptional regulator [Epibacterium sp. SM1979]|uniref:LysR family transcriptional regulator n=1 Tax=Tritonibacter litoralis TaxID=2662264 RepID=A0A843YDA2_9RHOB|nr:LysR family transcriptional regulator [Tritonibacter litoralis]MQQ09350.1 LysR family transcriptional regulator [Tritonibacter litoralis]